MHVFFSCDGLLVEGNKLDMEMVRWFGGVHFCKSRNVWDII